MEPTPQPARQWLNDQELEAVLARQKAAPIVMPPVGSGGRWGQQVAYNEQTRKVKPAIAEMATKPTDTKGKNDKRRFTHPLYNTSPITMGSFPTYPGDGSESTQPHVPQPIVEEVPNEEPVDGQPTIDVGQLESMGGADEISSEATAPAQVPTQGQPQMPSSNDPRIAELAGRLKTLEVGADKFSVENPVGADKYAGNKAMQDYLNQRLTRERDVHPFRRFVTGVANAIPENDTSALGHFARGYRGVRGEYDKEQKAQEGTMEELADVQGDQAIYDAIMKRGQEAGQFFNPQEAGELEQLQTEMKMQLDAQDRLRRQLLDEDLRNNRRSDNERADEAARRAQDNYEWNVSQRGQLTPNQKLMDEWRRNKPQGGQSDSYKQPPVSAVTEIADMQHDIQSMPPTVKEGGLFGFGGQEVPNPERVAMQKRLDYFLSVYPNPNSGQPQQMQQQGQMDPQQELLQAAQALTTSNPQKFPTVEAAVMAILQDNNGQ